MGLHKFLSESATRPQMKQIKRGCLVRSLISSIFSRLASTPRWQERSPRQIFSANRFSLQKHFQGQLDQLSLGISILSQILKTGKRGSGDPGATSKFGPIHTIQTPAVLGLRCTLNEIQELFGRQIPDMNPPVRGDYGGGAGNSQ